VRVAGIGRLDVLPVKSSEENSIRWSTYYWHRVLFMPAVQRWC